MQKCLHTLFYGFIYQNINKQMQSSTGGSRLRRENELVYVSIYRPFTDISLDDGGDYGGGDDGGGDPSGGLMAC